MTKEKVINEGKELLIVHAYLHAIGNQIPYFSITGEIWERKQDGSKKGREPIACGCLHEEILKAFPELAPLVAIHLSYMDGVPMHAVENAWYFNGGTKYMEFDADKLANHLRISRDEALRIHAIYTDKTDFSAYVESLKPAWAKEAQEAIDRFGLKISER